VIQNHAVFEIPLALAWMRGSPAASIWLRELPARVERCARRWDLELAEPFPQSFVSVVFPATRRDGSRAVLKIQYPHQESKHEAEALRAWNGNGAVKLFDHDPEEHALLLERCQPGDHLASVKQDEALLIFADILPRLWVAAGAPFRRLAEEAALWAERLPAEWEAAGRPFERALIDSALAALNSLIGTQGEQVLLSQDLHGDNVLRAQRGWLAIDPKPLVGERELALAPIIRGYDFGHSRANVCRRLNWLTRTLQLDRERSRTWAWRKPSRGASKGRSPMTSTSKPRAGC
jgi:streptomycin 6-kinase